MASRKLVLQKVWWQLRLVGFEPMTAWWKRTTPQLNYARNSKFCDLLWTLKFNCQQKIIYDVTIFSSFQVYLKRTRCHLPRIKNGQNSNLFVSKTKTKLLKKCWTLREEKANQDCIGWRADDVTMLVNSPADDITNKKIWAKAIL